MTDPIPFSRTKWDQPAQMARIAPLFDTVEKLLAVRDLDTLLESNQTIFPMVMGRLQDALKGAFVDGDPQALFETHKTLYFLYEEHIETPRPGRGYNQFHPFVMRLRNDIEKAWEQHELARFDLQAERIPDNDEAFVAYFKERCFTHRTASHPLFTYLEEQASHDDLVAFFLHEGTLVLRFCDLIVLSMVGADEEIRSELAENFWDEVGAGQYQNRHVEQFRRLLRYIGQTAKETHLLSDTMLDRLGWQGLAGYNLYLDLALHRRNFFRSMGALGIAEMMDPYQYSKIVRGCERVGLRDQEALSYYVGHAEMDIEHGDHWMANVMLPLARRYPEARAELVIGAEMRLNTAADYYDFLLHKIASSGATSDAVSVDLATQPNQVGVA